MSFIDAAPGIRVSVADYDPGPQARRATALFVHGWPVSHRMFEYQTDALPARGVRCVALDLRGFGASDKPWSGLGYDAWADDLRAVVDALDLRDVTLVGFSMGGAVAMHYMARQQGHRVARLALLGAAGPCLGLREDNPGGIPRAAHDGFVAAAQGNRAKLNVDFGAALFHRPAGAEIDSWLWGMGMEASPRATIRGVEELRDQDLRPGLPHIAVPTLICHGVHDAVIPFALGADQQARLIPAPHVVRFEESGHALFYEERERLNDELTRFALG